MKKRLVGVLILLIGCFPFLIAQNEIINSSENITTPQTITIPYFETFSSTTLPPLWTINQSNLFSFINQGIQPNATALNQDAMVKFAGYNFASGTLGYLRTPEITNLTTGMEVNFWFYRQTGSNGHPGAISVYANSSIDTTNAVLLTTIPRVYTKVPAEVSTGWYRYTAIIPADTFKFIIFKFYGDHTANMYLDEISITESILCTNPPMNSLVIQNFTSNSVNLKWQRGSNETSWEVGYKTINDNVWSFAISTDTFCTINSLLPSNTYQVKVRAICLQGGTSLWTFQKSFYTVCDPIQTIPYLMTFDSVPLNTIPPCFQTILDPNASIQTITLSGNNRGIDFCSSIVDNHCILILPPIQDSINSLRVKFKVVAGSPSYTAYLIGYVTDYTNPNSFEVLAAGNPVSNNWYSCDFNTLTSLTGNERFAIEVRTILNYHVRIDSIMVVYPDPCMPPLRLKSYQVQTNQATLDWDPSPYGTPTDYDLEYRVLNSSNWILIPNVNPPYTLTGLSAQTNYEYRIKSNCLPNLTQFTQPDTFATDCYAVFYNQYSETCEHMLPNSCWARESGYLLDSANAILQPTEYSWGHSTIFGDYTSKLDIEWYNHDWLITPPIDLGNGADLKQLEFDIAVTLSNSTSGGSLWMAPNARFVVLISTDYGETWNSTGILKEWNNYGANHFNTLNNTFQTQVIPLFDSITMSNYSGVVKFAFYGYIADYNGVYQNDIHIDNIIINSHSNCIKPRNIQATNISTTSMQINWTPTGTPISFLVEYGPEGFLHGNGTTLQTPQNSITINSLQSGTNYDFYIKSVCGVGDTSAWSIKKTYTTDCIPNQLPFFESFNSNIFSNCWKQTYSPALFNNRWSISQTNYAAGSGSEAKFTNYNAHGISRFISPPINIINTNNVALIFKYYLEDSFEGSIIKIQTSSDMVTWNDQPFSVFSGQGNIGPATCSILLNSLSQGINYVAWVVDGYHAPIESFYLDDISITTDSLFCPSPNNIIFSSLNNSTATLSWTPQGSETQWELACKPTTSSTWSTYIVNNNPSFLINTLSPSVSYNVKVRAVCNNFQGPYSAVQTFVHMQTYTINTTHDYNSSISPSGSVVVNAGSNQTFNFSTNTGYVLSMINIDGVSQIPVPNTYTFTNVQSNHTINVFSILSNNVEESPESVIKLFPNPANTYIELQMDLSLLNSNSCKIYNWYGQLVKDQMMKSEKTVINISDFAVGVYLVFLETKQGIYTIKFVKN